MQINQEINQKKIGQEKTSSWICWSKQFASAIFGLFLHFCFQFKMKLTRGRPYFFYWERPNGFEKIQFDLDLSELIKFK